MSLPLVAILRGVTPQDIIAIADEIIAGDTSTIASAEPQLAPAARAPKVTSDANRRTPLGGLGT